MKFRELLYRILVLIIILVLWQLLPTFELISPYVLSPFTSVIETFPQLFNTHGLIPGGMIPQLLTTLTELGAAFGLSVGIGLTLGLLLSYFKLVGNAYEPLIYLIYAIPGSIYYPVLFLTLGLGVQSKIALGFLFGVFPLIINVLSGSKKLNQLFVRLAKSMGANGTQIFIKIMIPALAPYIMSGLRLSLVFSFIGVILGEVIASKDGLGFAISVANYNFETPLMYDYIIIVILLATLFLGIILLIERKVFKYG
ncbi:MAG: ABC transporter permease subunit [Saccharolobus sp.]|uniref:ABC transporter permease n=1 Tax=Saccharolobus TaxID=2100760 RepID=UPI001F11047C|nr:ABC transporter permease subunit [Saccharolobus shibatae]MCH4815793.1 ABC transporter permease subunit [Saccharolobus shibatae]